MAKKKMYMDTRMPTNHMNVSPPHDRQMVKSSVRIVMSSPQALKKPANGS